jgi:cytochrome c-type biogenesis protein CcsB
MNITPDTLAAELEQPGFFRTLNLYDWLWALCVLGGAGFALSRYSGLMDAFEVGILILTGLTTVWLGWAWKPFRPYGVAVALISLLGIGQYGDAGLAAAESRFLLKYLVSSQSAVMWMSALFVLATAAYLVWLVSRSDFSGRVATALTWCASVMGLVGLMVRWFESYLIGTDVGHIPVSNLYEVFILFAVITGLLYLYYEGRYRTRALGLFVLLVISAAVAFLLWYTFDRQAHQIQPLVPALQSYWMKIHVPTNFVGYGAFALAAMVAIAYLLSDWSERRGGGLARILPDREMMDDVMYKAIALGFAFFTIATVLGAMWAAEAWGGYWSWDPKETWALIVWLNYAAWLHMRLMKGWRGVPMAWWSLIGLFVTLFAFVGVNMFLSGLHSYGEL